MMGSTNISCGNRVTVGVRALTVEAECARVAVHHGGLTRRGEPLGRVEALQEVSKAVQAVELVAIPVERRRIDLRPA